MTEKLTLDTNSIRDWAWCEGLSSETRYNNDPAIKATFTKTFNDLRRLRDDGICEIGVTTQIFSDNHQTRGELPVHIANMIGVYANISVPSLMSFPLVFPIVFPDKQKFERLFKDIFSDSLSTHHKYQSNRLDAWQVYAHKVASRDYFVTHDKTILRASETLKSKWEILVISVEEYVSNRV
jgi:hypothetical protein